MNIIELKAHAFDAINMIEQWQRELQETNKLIGEAIRKEQEEKKFEEQEALKTKEVKAPK